MGTLLAFAGGFELFDAFLDLFLKGFLEKLSAFDEEKVFHLIEDMSVLGVVGDEIAFVDEGIEFGVKKFTTARAGGFGLHKIPPCKKGNVKKSITNPHKIFTHPVGVRGVWRH
jgi:hypothetical protein